MKKMTIPFILGGMLMASTALPAVYHFHDGTEYADKLDGTQTSITLTGNSAGQLTLTALSDTSESPILKEGGGGKISGVGVDSKGGNSADNGTLIEHQKAPQIYNEGLALSFMNAAGQPAAAKLISFEVTAFEPGGVIDISLDAGATPFDSFPSDSGLTYLFPDNSIVSADTALKLLAGSNTRFRLRSIHFEIAGEEQPSTPVQAPVVVTAPIVQQSPPVSKPKPIPEPEQPEEPKTIGFIF